MKETRVAHRYAKALFELAIEMNVLEKVRADSELIYKVCIENKAFVHMLKSPVIRADKKLSIVKAIFDKHLCELTLRYLVIIIRNRREELVMAIAQEFIAIYKDFKNILPAFLTTAVEIDAETKKRILDLLHEYTDAKIELNESIDEKLIGGFVLDFEDKQFDSSILRKIKNLRQEFDVNLYIKGF